MIFKPKKNWSVRLEMGGTFGPEKLTDSKIDENQSNQSKTNGVSNQYKNRFERVFFFLTFRLLE